MSEVYGAGLWDLRENPESIPAAAKRMLPGAHVVAVCAASDTDRTGIALRRAGYEIRDTIVWDRPGGHLLVTLGRAPLDGKVAENVLKHGVGALNIDATRIPIGDADKAASEAKNAHTKFGSGPRANHVWGQDKRDSQDWSGDLGRFPANVLLQHDAACKVVGTSVNRGDARGDGPYEVGRRPGGFGDTGAAKGDTHMNSKPYGAAAVLVYDCQPGCPVAALDARSGERRAGVFPPARGKSVSSNFGHTGQTVGGYRLVGDVGGASRYFARFATDEEVWAWLEALIVPPDVAVSRTD